VYNAVRYVNKLHQNIGLEHWKRELREFNLAV